MCRYLPTQDTLFVEPARLCTDRSSNQPLAPPPPFPPPSVCSSFLWCLWKRQTVVLSSTAEASSIATPTRPMRGNMMTTTMMLAVTTSSANSNKTATKALSLRYLRDSSLNLDIHVQLIYKAQPLLGYVAGIFCVATIRGRPWTPHAVWLLRYLDSSLFEWELQKPGQVTSAQRVDKVNFALVTTIRTVHERAEPHAATAAPGPPLTSKSLSFLGSTIWPHRPWKFVPLK